MKPYILVKDIQRPTSKWFPSCDLQLLSLCIMLFVYPSYMLLDIGLPWTGICTVRTCKGLAQVFAFDMHVVAGLCMLVVGSTYLTCISYPSIHIHTLHIVMYFLKCQK